MVLVRLLGGLGNQLFQYAAARSFAETGGHELVMDTSEFSTYQVHSYALSNLCIQARELPFGNKPARFIHRAADRLGLLGFSYAIRGLGLKPWTTLSDEDPIEKLEPTAKRVVMKGFWQNEKYFWTHRAGLLKEFSLRESLSPQGLKIREEILKSEVSISLHIRRGDYVTNPQALKVHGVLPLSYYNNAMAVLGARLSLGAKTKVFVFSDDPDWAEANLKLSCETYIVRGSPEKNYEDLFLMSVCDHHIIANSSFSWWGAWLNQKTREPIVIAPTEWYQEASLGKQGPVPDRWLKVSSKT